jgi:hypothetical protein
MATLNFKQIVCSSSELSQRDKIPFLKIIPQSKITRTKQFPEFSLTKKAKASPFKTTENMALNYKPIK